MRAALLVLALTACTSKTKGVGDDPADDVALADSEATAHLAAALGDDGTTTVGQFLLDQAPAFLNAPNPDSMFQTAYERHISLPALSGTPRNLRVLTYNTGLLSRHYAVIAKVAVPNIDERRAVMGETLFAAGYDVLFLQEVWEVADRDALIAAGTAAGYTVWGGDGDGFHKETGLVIAVKSDLIGGTETKDQGQYQAQWKTENFPGPNLKRGWLAWSFPLADTGVTVDLFDTHTTAFSDEWWVRDLQARELGQRVAQAPAGDLVLVAGDMNAGWYYASDTWVDGDGKEIPGWWANAAAIPLLMYYGGLEDAKNAGSPNEDVQLGDLVPTGGGASFLAEPFGDATFCDRFPPTTFTATDCNSLYFQNYAGTEYPARLDQILFRDGTGRMRVTDQSLVFSDPMDFGAAGSFELSDHYGVEVDLEIGE